MLKNCISMMAAKNKYLSGKPFVLLSHKEFLLLAVFYEWYFLVFLQLNKSFLFITGNRVNLT